MTGTPFSHQTLVYIFATKLSPFLILACNSGSAPSISFVSKAESFPKPRFFSKPLGPRTRGVEKYVASVKLDLPKDKKYYAINVQVTME